MYWKKIQGSGPDSGRMGSGSDIFGYLFYFRVFLGIPWCFWVYRISSLFLEVVGQILRISSFIY